MDGVLIDAKEWHYEALNLALKPFGYTIEHDEHIETYDGLPTSKKLPLLTKRKGLPEAHYPAIINLKQKYTMELVEQRCRPTAWHLQALSKLKSLNYRLGVASNSIRQTVEIMMKKSGLDQYLDVMLSNEDVSRPKPHPEIYLKAMQMVKCSPGTTLVIEDNPIGIRAARAAGACVMTVAKVEDVNFNNIRRHILQFEVMEEEDIEERVLAAS